MADRLVVACVQQKMHLPLTLDEYREDLRRFLRVAVAKQARLVVFPELGGVMSAAPMLDDFRSQLLKRADRGRRRQANLWQRSLGGLAGVVARMVRADFRAGLAGLLDVAGPEVWQLTQSTFGGLAREFSVTLVAPSAYLPDPVDGVIRNMTCVFDSQGNLLGRQAKVVLPEQDTDLAQPGSTWDVIPTEVGRLGVILGSDVLYPEVGRVLAFQGADALIMQAACTDALQYNKLRAGALARMQDNQVFAALSFLVGANRLGRGRRNPYVGKSAVFAPQELTPRENGVLVEMGTVRAEGVLAAPWEYPALRRLWETSETPLRRHLPMQQAGQVLAQLYARLQGLPAPQDGSDTVDDPALSVLLRRAPRRLEDLEVIGSVTHSWPLPIRRREDGADSHALPTPTNDVSLAPAAATVQSAFGQDREPVTVEDETDEMDAISDRDRGS